MESDPGAKHRAQSGTKILCALGVPCVQGASGGENWDPKPSNSLKLWTSRVLPLPLVNPGMESTISQTVETWLICATNNPHIRSLKGPQIRPLQVRGKYAGENWQILLSCWESWGISGISGAMDTLSGCVEGFPPELKWQLKCLRLYWNK